MGLPFKRIDHVELYTGDPQRALRFYTEVLGFSVRSRAAIPGGLDIVYLDLGGTTLELLCRPQAALERGAGGERLGYRMIALEVESMDQAIDYLKTKGIEVAWGLVTRPDYARAEIRDPDGNPIELRHWIKPA
jgi:catechol 2,3-dioxygenase-like lactoylglutathione lyase family enzyme